MLYLESRHQVNPALLSASIQHDLQMVMHRAGSLGEVSSRQMTITPPNLVKSLPATVQQLPARMTAWGYCP